MSGAHGASGGMALALATLAALGGWFFVFSLPDRYDATRQRVRGYANRPQAGAGRTDRPGRRNVPAGICAAVDSGPARGMEKIAVEAGVLRRRCGFRKTAEVVSSLASHVAIEAKLASADAYESSGTIYSITYSDNDSDRAVRVTKTVMDTFIRIRSVASRKAPRQPRTPSGADQDLRKPVARAGERSRRVQEEESWAHAERSR